MLLVYSAVLSMIWTMNVVMKYYVDMQSCIHIGFPCSSLLFQLLLGWCTCRDRGAWGTMKRGYGGWRDHQREGVCTPQDYLHITITLQSSSQRQLKLHSSKWHVLCTSMLLGCYYIVPVSAWLFFHDKNPFLVKLTTHCLCLFDFLFFFTIRIPMRKQPSWSYAMKLCVS